MCQSATECICGSKSVAETSKRPTQSKNKTSRQRNADGNAHERAHKRREECGDHEGGQNPPRKHSSLPRCAWVAGPSQNCNTKSDREKANAVQPAKSIYCGVGALCVLV